MNSMGSEMTSEHVTSIRPHQNKRAPGRQWVRKSTMPSTGDGDGDAVGEENAATSVSWKSWHNSKNNKSEPSRPDTNLTSPRQFLMLQENDLLIDTRSCAGPQMLNG